MTDEALIDFAAVEAQLVNAIALLEGTDYSEHAGPLQTPQLSGEP